MLGSLRHLNALRAFEAAARHSSFARAAAELNVSHSVISQHIKTLEQWLGTELFRRLGNRVELSEDGRALLPQVSNGFQVLNDACDGLLRMTQSGTLVVSAEPALASLWLRKRITEFCEEYPKIDIDLRPAWQPPQLGEGHADVVIHFETRQSAGEGQQQRLFPIIGFPACTPELHNRLLADGPCDWNSVPLVHDNGREIWHKWFSAHQPSSLCWQEGRVYSDLSLAIEAAVDGEGVVLADEVLCAKALQSGALVKLDPRQIECVWYTVASPNSTREGTAADSFVSWLGSGVPVIETQKD
ncbi:LysR family transcriptional regulator [Leisingera sp. McT4-56]|uniref:LysR family transcriptional regulator n=1 Tax=Leisingera sp. McT4-56 TaxID=2881255 RepID=UPI001CF8E908|nr:LysR family transcriptional regulator [Leisingera sp. McT4-56]MCB4457991.1 LysR family transcriptional regulator [Leisingera sp. McT4-56]